MKCSIFLVILGSVALQLNAEESLYDVLGVRKSASAKDIKQAYKKMAKEWHPDKNPDPAANERFMQINNAYETLSDKDKRAEYDNFGTTAAQADGGRRGRGNPFGGFDDSPFGNFFRQDGFRFNFGGGNRHESNVGKYRLTLQNYKDSILPNSRTKPYLIYGYADFCYQCMQVELIWDKIVQDMNTIGMGIGSVNVQLDRALTSKLRISDVPSIMGVIDGKVTYFQGRLSLADLRDFVRSMLPSDVVAEVNDRNYKDFLSGWEDNRVRMLFFGSRKIPSLRYLLPAYSHRDRVAAGYVNLAHINSEFLQSEFNIQKGMESLLMFNEYFERPIAHISMSSLSLSTLNEVIETNKYLTLPRLSNQQMFNTLCPLYTSIRRKKLCVLLLANSRQEHTAYLDGFRDYARGHMKERVKFAYVYEDSQGDFVKTLTKGQGIVNKTLNTLKVAVVWRSEQMRINYDWLEDGWAVDDPEKSLSQQRLSVLIDMSLRSRDVLPFSMEMMADLIDENRGALFFRILSRLSQWLDTTWEMIISMDEITLITLGTTITFIVVIALMMKMMVNSDDDAFARNNWQDSRRTAAAREHSTVKKEAPVVYVNTLCADTFQEIVLDLQPGVRTIVILVNEASRHKLLQNFATVVQPYARSDAFKFAFIQLEEYLGWYKDLLEATLDHSRNLDNINIANCIELETTKLIYGGDSSVRGDGGGRGCEVRADSTYTIPEHKTCKNCWHSKGTVLALNGKRKYFSVYHAAAESFMRRRAVATKKKVASSQLGDFLGFDQSDESDWETEDDGGVGAEDRLLDTMLLSGLQTWMDRLCEGSLRRLRVDDWPSMEKSSPA